MKEIKLKDIGVNFKDRRIEGIITLDNGTEVVAYIDGEELTEIMELCNRGTI